MSCVLPHPATGVPGGTDLARRAARLALILALIGCSSVADAAVLNYGFMPQLGLTTGGTSVTLSGMGLADVTAVSVGGMPVAIDTVDPMSLHITLPPGPPGPAEIVVIDGSTGERISWGNFLYVARPVLSVTSGPIEGGTSVTISGSGFTGATGVSFNGVTAIFTAPDDATITATTPAHPDGPGPVSLTIDYAAGSLSFDNAFTYNPPADGAPVSSSSEQPPAPSSDSSAPASSSAEPPPEPSSPSSEAASQSSSAPALPPASDTAAGASSPASIAIATPSLMAQTASELVAPRVWVLPMVSNAVRSFFAPSATLTSAPTDLSALGKLGHFYAAPQGAGLSSSLSAIDAAAGNREPRNWDSFVDADVGAIASGATSGGYATGHVGLAARVTPTAIAGVVVTLDTRTLASANMRSDATGIMLTPFLGGRLGSALFFDLSAGYGLTQMTITGPTSVDHVLARRWGVGGSLSGSMPMGGFVISPAITASLMGIATDAHRDSSGAPIAATSTGQGDLAFAPQVAFPTTMLNGLAISPSLGASLGLGLTTSDHKVNWSGATSSLTLGLDLATEAGAHIGLGVSVDAPTRAKAQSLSGHVSVNGRLR